MKRLTRTAGTAATVAMALVLAACGGDGGMRLDSTGAAPAPAPAPVAGTPTLVEGTDVPLTTLSDGAAATAFANQLASSADETGEPLRVGNVVLATSETDEPAALN